MGWICPLMQNQNIFIAVCLTDLLVQNQNNQVNALENTEKIMFGAKCAGHPDS